MAINDDRLMAIQEAIFDQLVKSLGEDKDDKLRDLAIEIAADLNRSGLLAHNRKN